MNNPKLTSLAIFLALLTAWAQTESNVPYLNVNGAMQTANDVTVIHAGNIGTIDNLSGWYLVRGNLERSTSLTVSGTAHIILEDGCDLAVIMTTLIGAGINVSSTNVLTIYAQSSDENNMGKLTVSGRTAAGIGGGPASGGTTGVGTITINGGIVIATGGNSAGIGGGNSGSNGANITINGGIVMATGSGPGAGIGGGTNSNGNGNGGIITINGGIVTATSTNSAGIGGGQGSDARGFIGDGGDGGTITINGGIVTATSIGGGSSSPASGLGLSGTPGTLAISGNAIVFTNSVGDMSTGNKTGGILVAGNATHWYSNNIFLIPNVTVPSGHLLTIAADKILIIPEDKILTIDGTVMNNGTIFNFGTINGTVDGNSPITRLDIDLSIANPLPMGSGWTFTDNIYTIRNGANVAITGTSANQRRIELAENATANITLNDATIQGLGSNQAPLLLNNGANATLMLTGTNTLAAGSNSAGIQAPEGTMLRITGTGILTATGGTNAQGIGRGSGSSTAGTFAMDGNAIVFANSVGDTEVSRKTGGILFIGNNGMVYGNTELANNLEIQANQTLAIPADATLTIPANITLANNGTTKPENNSAVIVEGAVTGNKIIGANANEPTANEITQTSIAINAAVLLAATGQTTEYAINTANSMPANGWQAETLFTDLSEGETYWIFARSKENTHFAAGAAPEALQAKTIGISADDLIFTMPTDHIYNGEAQGIGNVTAKTTGLGNITVYYTSTNYAKTTAAPTNAGTYAITVDISESESYRATTNVLLGNYVIARAVGTGTVSMEDWYFGETLISPVAKSETNGTEGIAYLYWSTDNDAYPSNSAVPANIGLYAVQATFPETQNYNSFTKQANFRIMAPTELTVAWSEQRIFEYNKMVQSPTASVKDGNIDIPLHISGTQSAAGIHSIMAMIIDETLRRRYNLRSNTIDYEITKKDLKPYFRTTLPAFKYDKETQTLEVPSEAFTDYDALTKILESIIAYDGFATNTETNESDNISALRGEPTIQLSYEGPAASPSLLSRRVETTQKATAIIITDNVSADNYALIRQTITIIEMEDDNVETIFCNRSGYCTELSEEVCLFVGGTAATGSCDIARTSCLIDADRCVANMLLRSCVNIGGTPSETCGATPILPTPYSPTPRIWQSASGVINLDLGYMPIAPVALQIYDLNGKLISSEHVNTRFATVKVNVSNGIYVFKIGSRNIVRVLK